MFDNNIQYRKTKGILMNSDEELIGDDDFADGRLAVLSKLMIRRTFVVSKKSIVKSHGLVNKTSLKKYHKNFCHYFSCYQ